MFLEKLLYRLSLVPTRPIDVKPDGIALQPSIEMPKHLEKCLPITAARLKHTVPTQQRGDPPRHIQSQSMLTGRGNAQALSPFSPPPTQSRMQAKARLVLEDHRLPRSQRLKFFLKPCGTSGPLRLSLADKCNWLASADTPSDASISGPALPLRLSQSAALSGSPKLAHPTALDSAQSLAAISPGVRRWLFAPWALSQWACQASASVVKPADRLGSPHGSNGSDSYELSPRLPLSILDAGPLGPKARRRSLSLPRPQGFPRPRLKDALSSLRGEPKSEKGFSCSQDSIIVAICNFI